MVYHIPFLKSVSTRARSLSPSFGAVCFMQYHCFSAVFMQIRKSSAARLTFHGHASLRGTKTIRVLISVGKGGRSRDSKRPAKD